MPPFVHVLIEWNFRFPVGFGRNDNLYTARVEFFAQPVCIKGLVGEECIEFKPLNQGWNANDIMTLAGHQDEFDQIAQPIDKSQYFGCQSAF